MASESGCVAVLLGVACLAEPRELALRVSSYVERYTGPSRSPGAAVGFVHKFSINSDDPAYFIMERQLAYIGTCYGCVAAFSSSNLDESRNPTQLCDEQLRWMWRSHEHDQVALTFDRFHFLQHSRRVQPTFNAAACAPATARFLAASSASFTSMLASSPPVMAAISAARRQTVGSTGGAASP